MDAACIDIWLSCSHTGSSGRIEATNHKLLDNLHEKHSNHMADAQANIPACRPTKYEAISFDKHFQRRCCSMVVGIRRISTNYYRSLDLVSLNVLRVVNRLADCRMPRHLWSERLLLSFSMLLFRMRNFTDFWLCSTMNSLQPTHFGMNFVAGGFSVWFSLRSPSEHHKAQVGSSFAVIWHAKE